MSLEGAKLICLDEAGNHCGMVLAKGRKFTMGYYVSSDYVLVDERAKGVHCVIECDAFGRVTIRNLSPDKPILVNGSAVEIKRSLLNNSKLSILDKEYLWQFPKSSSNEFEDLHTDDASTPQKQVGIPEQPPNSCPDFKLHRELPKRFTIHNFAYCIQSDEEGNISSDSNDKNTNKDIHTTQTNQSENENDNQTNQDKTKDSNKNTTDTEAKTTQKRSITPEPHNELANASTDILETPKMNLINCTKDKENKSTENKHKTVLTMCHLSDVVITSFSPRETGVKVEKSFATIVKPKVLVTKPPTTTPKSVYSTPKSDMNDRDVDDENESELISFYTPSTSKKGTVINTAFAKVHKNSSMHLIDLTTPKKIRSASPYLKSALKASATKNITETVDKNYTKLPLEGQLGLSILPLTPVLAEASNSPLQTPSSVISVSSSIDTSSIIEVTSDGYNLGATPSNATGATTPLKALARTGAYTPKRTPQSLMKRALLTSAKKQTTPQSNTQIPTTPRRESINRIPLRSNIALLRTPVTPQASTGNISTSELPKRHSMSTPTRKIMSTKRSSNITSVSPLTSSKLLSRLSSPNPISAANALPTSTPVSISSNNSVLKARAACKTSPLYKVRKSIGGVPLSTHISKTRRSLLTPASTSKITSIKEKSPQQVISERLVSRARKSVCVTPISARSRNMVTAANTPSQAVPSSILKDNKTQSVKKPERKAVLFTDKPPQKSGEVDDLSRTFIVDSDEEENEASKKQKEKPSDATFSPKKDLNKSKKLAKNLDTKAEDLSTIEIPVDVEEIKGIDKSSQEKYIILEKKNKITCTESQESESLTEESFAEIINDSQEQINLRNTIEISDSPKESLQNKSHKMMNDAVDAVVLRENTKDLVKILPQNDNEQTEILETGFGEESFVEVSLTPKEKVIQDENAANDEDNLKKTEHENKTELQVLGESKNIQCDQQKVQTHVQEVEAELTEKEAESTSEETKSVAIQNDEDKIELKVVDPKSEYKPIVEDITLEGSLIEKEIKEMGESNVGKPPLCEDITLEVSLIEKKVKTEEFDEEKVLKDATIINLLSNSAKEFHQIEKTELHIIEDESKISQIREIATTPEHEISKVDYAKHIEQLKTNRNELALLDTHELREVDGEKTSSDSLNIIKELQVLQTESLETFQIVKETSKENVEKATESIEKLETSDATPFNIIQVNETTFNENLEKTVNKSDTAQDQQASKSETKSSKIIENKIDDLENTNKLLEEIEDVLNKSDEIKQKHISELAEFGQLSEKPLTEELETEKLFQETNQIVKEVTSSSNGNKNIEIKSFSIVKELEESTITNKKVLEISDKSTPSPEIKLIENKDDTTSQEQEISSTEYFVTDTETSVSKSKIEPSKNEVENVQCEEQEYKSSEDTVHLTEKNCTSIEEKTYLIAHEESKVEENEEEQLVESIVLQSEEKPKEYEIVIQSNENLKEFKVKGTENIVSESDDIFSIEENSKLIVQREPLPKETELIVSSEDTIHLTENNTSIEKKCEPAAREESKVKVNDEEQLVENIVFQSEDKPKESEIVVQNKENLKELEVIGKENIVSESDGIFSIEENQKLIIQREPLPTETDLIVSSEDNVHLTENYTTIEKKCEPAARKESKVKENEEEQLVENIVFQSDDNPKESEIVIQNKENLKELENIASESEEIISIEKNPKLVIQKEPKPKITESNVSSEIITEECESQKPNSQEKGSIVVNKYTSRDVEGEVSTRIENKKDSSPSEGTTELSTKETPAKQDIKSKENDGNLDDQSAAAKYLCQNQEPKFSENTSASTDNKTVRSPRPNEHSSNLEDESKELSFIKKKIENPTSFTPRRSSRRASQSTETPQTTTEQTITPRRSARRASMSAETTSTSTPTKRTTRRASLSAVSETLLTPKHITKRRSSITVEDVTFLPSTSKTPRKQLEHRTVISVENKVVDAVIIEEEEEATEENVQLEENKRRTTVIPEEMDNIVGVILEEEELESVQHKTKNNEEKVEIGEILEKESTTPTELSKKPTKAVVEPLILETRDVIENPLSVTEKKLENLEIVSTSDESKVYAAYTLEMKVITENLIHKEKLATEKDEEKNVDVEENIEVKTKPAISKNKFDEKQNTVECIKKRDVIKDNLEEPLADEVDKMLPKELITEERNTTFVKLVETPELKDCLFLSPTVVKIVETSDHKEISETSIPSDAENIKKISNAAQLAKTPTKENANISTDMEVYTPTTKRSVNSLANSPKTPLMSGMRELLKTPKAEAQTPRLRGIRDLLRTPKEKLECEDEEMEKLSMVAELVSTPKPEVDISTPKSTKLVKIVADSPKTPAITDMQQLLKTPKAEVQTPQLSGILDLKRTPREKIGNIVDNLVIIPKAKNEISTSNGKKQVRLVVDSPKTPVMTGMRELLKTPKAEMATPKLVGIRNLVRTPKTKLEMEQEEIEKFAAVSELIKTPQVSKITENITEELSPKSANNDNLKGIKELLNTPKSCSTPRFKGMRELMQTPKMCSTPLMSGMKELLESTAPEVEKEPTVEIADNSETLTVEEIPSSTSKNIVNLQGVNDLLKTPKSFGTPNLRGIRELMQTPKMCSTPLIAGIKELMNPQTQQKDHELEKFLRTPTAKNIMISSMPSSAVIEKSSDSIEISTEYDLNATNEQGTVNLEELFKTPVASRFVERITSSYYGEEGCEHIETVNRFTKNITLQETLNKSAEEAYDKLVGQETQIQTPIRKIYPRKSFNLQTPQAQSPFTAADVLSDLPKSDVEEWIETLDEAEPPPMLELANVLDESHEEIVKQDIPNESIKEHEDDFRLEYSLNEKDEQNISNNESIIPETCTKVYLTEKTLTTASLTKNDTTDPLSNTSTKPKEIHIRPATPMDAEISGIDLLDQTIESAQDEPSMLDDPLVVEEPSMFEEPLLVSDNDNESEADNTLNNIESQDEANDLSEPLLLSDSEDLNQSQELETNEDTVEDLQTTNLNITAQGKSLLENVSNAIDSTAEEPLDNKLKEPETLAIVLEMENKTEIDDSQQKEEYKEKETSNDIRMTDSTDLFDKNETSEVISSEIIEMSEIVEQKSSEALEISISCPIEEVSIDRTEKELSENPETLLTKETLDAEIDASETNVIEENDDKKSRNQNIDAKEISIKQTKVVSDESENIFLDTSVTEIFEETNISNEEQVDQKENKDIKKTSLNSNQTNQEHEDIFMDNSNIDESFADEAFNENEENDVENESAIVKVTRKEVSKNETKSLSISANSDNKDNTSVNIVTVCEIEESKVEEKSVAENIMVINEEKNASQKVKNPDDEEFDLLIVAEETSKKDEAQTSVKYSLEEQNELSKLQSQIEAQSSNISEIKLNSLVETPCESDNSLVKLHCLEKKKGGSLVIQLGSLNETIVHISNDEISKEQQKKSKDSTEIIDQFKSSISAVSLVTGANFKEKIHHYSDPIEILPKNIKTCNVSVNQISEVSDVQTDKDFEFKKSGSLISDQIGQLEKGACILNKSAITRESSLESTEHLEQYSPAINTKNASIEEMSSTMTEDVDETSSTKKEENKFNNEESSKTLNNIAEYLDNSKTSAYSKENQSSSQNKTFNSLKETKDETPTNLEVKSKIDVMDQKCTSPTEEVSFDIHKDTKATSAAVKVGSEDYKQDKNLKESSVKEIEKNLTEEVAVKSSDILKTYDFEIKINDTDHLKETETESSAAKSEILATNLHKRKNSPSIETSNDDLELRASRKNNKDTKTEETTFESETQPTKSFVAEKMQNSQAEKNERLEKVIVLNETEEISEDTEQNILENLKEEIKENEPKMHSVRIRKNRTMSESSQDSIHDDKPSSSSRRDRRNVMKKPIENKLEEVKEEKVNEQQTLKELTFELVKEGENPKRKRSASESSQESVKKDDNSTSTRRGGRRKLLKPPTEETVIEQKLEDEDLEAEQILKETKNPEKDIEKLKKPFTLTEIKSFYDTEKSKNLKEKVNEFPMEKQEHMEREIAESADCKQLLTKAHKQVTISSTSDKYHIKVHKESFDDTQQSIEKHRDESKEDLKSSLLVKDLNISKEGIIEVLAENMVVEHKEKVAAEIILSDETSTLAINKEQISDTSEENVFKSLKSPENITKKPLEIENEIKKSDEVVVSEDTLLTTLNEDQKENIITDTLKETCNENKASVRKCIRSNETISEPSESSVLAKNINTIITASPGESVDVPVKELITTDTSEIKDNSEEVIETAQESLPEVEVADITMEEFKEQLVRRGRRNPTMSESSQGSVQEDHKIRAIKTRQKVQKAPVEEIIVEGDLIKEEVVVVATSTKKLSETKLFGVIEHKGLSELADNEIVKIQSITLEEGKEQTVKHGRHKATVSVKNALEVNEEEKTSETEITTENEEDKHEIIFKDVASKPSKADLDVVESKQSPHSVNLTSKVLQTLKKVILEDQTSEAEIDDDKSKKIIGRRGRHKHDLPETAIEEPTTSRKGRRKVHPLTGKVSPKEVSAKHLETESDTKTPQEIVAANIVAKIITVKEDQTVQGIVISNVENETLLDSIVELQEQQVVGDTIPESSYVSTLHKTRRGGRQKVKDVEKLPRESTETEENAKVEQKTALKQITKRGRHLRHDNKEVSVENAVKVEDLIPESDEETSKEPSKVDHFTKQTVKRGRQRKHEVDEVPVEKAGNPEDKIPESDATLQGARHKSAVLKGRTARNRKTPFENITSSNQQELAEIIDDVPTSFEAIPAEDSKVRTSSRNCKSIVEQQTIFLKPEEQPVARTLSRNRKTPIETIVNEESIDTLKQTDKIPRKDDKTESENIDILDNCKDQEFSTFEDAAQKAAEYNKEKEDNDVKKRAKRTLTASESSQVSVDGEKPNKTQQMAEKEQSLEEVFEANVILPQNQEPGKDNLEEIIQSHDEKVKFNEAIEEKPQKSTRRIATAKDEKHYKHDEATSTKSQKRRGANDKNKQHGNTENVEEPHGETLLSEVKITEVNLEPEKLLDQQTSQEEEEVLKEVIGKKSRRKVAANKHLEDYETLPVTKRRAVVKHIEHSNDESGPSNKRRRKQADEVNDTEEEHVKHTVTSETTSRRQNFGKRKLEPEQKDNNINEVKHDADEETKHAESSETTIRRRNIGRKKHEDNDKPKPEEVRAHIESSDDKTNKLRNVDTIQHDRNRDHKDDDVSSEQKQEETKKGRGRRQKSDPKEETEQLKISLHSPETKQRGRKRKELHTDTCDPDPKDDCSEDNITKDPQTNVNIPSAHIEHHTPLRTTSIARRGRKASAIEHITAESQELDDTPGRRARNVPQRRAATAYHNYDETSDSEVSSKTKKKIDSPRKSLEAVEKFHTATVTTATIINLSPLPSSTTARGRTRKPTAKVQQLLEEERAKAESPKKRGLLAAAATAATGDIGTPQHTPARRGRKASTIETVVAGTSQATAAGCGDTGTPQRTPARRGQKASTIETVVAGTPQAVKGRGRGIPAVVHTKEEPSSSVVEDKEAELHTTPPNANHIKGRRGRKAKITEEDHQTGDEPSAKKSPLEFESKKQDSSASVEPPTPPTREAGRRNAAAAAKARIEEDAIAAASIDPPKRARAKKVLTKVATPDAPSSEMEEEQAAINKKTIKNKNSPQKREHRLASATTVEGDEDVENDIETETSDKPTNKRGRKKATAISTDSPAVPVKKRRNAKTIEEVANTDIPEESKTTRGRGRGRKNVHFDEHEEAESTTSNQQKTNNNETATPVETTEPVKKGTRSRRK